MIKYLSAIAMVLVLAGCSSGEKEVPKENVFSGQTQALDKAKETAAAVEQVQQAQQQQIQQQIGEQPQGSQQ
jgi:hypothetical protein